LSLGFARGYGQQYDSDDPENDRNAQTQKTIGDVHRRIFDDNLQKIRQNGRKQ
jgi:hypothetical protein